MAGSKEVEATPPSGSDSNPAISHLQTLENLGNQVENRRFLIVLFLNGEKYFVTLIPASMDFNQFQLHVRECLKLSNNSSFILDWHLNNTQWPEQITNWSELRSPGDWNASLNAAIPIPNRTISSLLVRVTLVPYPQQGSISAADGECIMQNLIGGIQSTQLNC